MSKKESRIKVFSTVVEGRMVEKMDAMIDRWCALYEHTILSVSSSVGDGWLVVTILYVR